MFVFPAYVATVALLSLRSFASASPLVVRAGQGVWNPPITAPQAGDVWTVGSTQLVTWDTDQIPPSAADDTGTLLLGYFDDHGEGENLDIDNPLASDFLLVDGCVQVEIPDVKPRDTYIVVLMGNSGNSSPEFTITNNHKSSTSSSPDDAMGQEDSGDLEPSQLPPDFPAAPVSPLPPSTPDPAFPDPEIDPMDSQALSEDATDICEERPETGSTSGSASNTTSDEDPHKRC